MKAHLTSITLTSLITAAIALPLSAQEHIPSDTVRKPVTNTSLWISDVLYVPLRSGKGNQYRILNKGLKSGTELKLVEEDEDGTWTLVEDASGIQGWVRSQYILKERPASQQLILANQRISRLQNERDQLNKKLKKTSGEHASASKSAQSLEQENATLARELKELKAVSAGAVSLHQRHQELMKSHQLMETELDVLKADNSRLKDDRNMTFFLYGIGAVIIGTLLPWLSPLLRRRKRQSEWG